MGTGGLESSQTEKKTVQDRYVKEICDELGITRASIGIITGEAAHMYFRTGRYSIGIDDLRRLNIMVQIF
jgi:hypothetical protein